MNKTATFVPDVTDMPLINSAYKYLEYGICTLPKSTKGKFPVISKWKDYQYKLPTPEELDFWYTNYSQPIDGLVIVTGEISGITVIDIDSDEAKSQLWELLGEEFPTPATNPIIETPRGHHIYLPYTPEIKQTTNLWGIEGLDARNDGGVVVAPPTKNYRRMKS
tara:strand:- start:7862 stop:8353 length:492 start_codon:yes stop_codon:yes gene_type:complete